MDVNFQPSFLGLNTFKYNGVTLLKPYNGCARNSVVLRFDTRFEPVYEKFETIVTNSKDDLDRVAYSQFTLNRNYMFIESMHTNSSVRSLGIGTCLHLNNIVEMFKNGIEVIELSASSTAIPFHLRLGFKPCDIWTDNMIRNLRYIASERDYRLKSFSESAKSILSSDYSKDLKARLANNLISDYITEASKFKDKDELKKLMRCATQMRLTRSDVLKNKDFYNELFKRYKIDYEIVD